MIRKIVVAACVILACVGPVAAAQNGSTFKVMTQNMDAGTDLGYALYGLQQPDPRPYIDLTLAEVDASQIPARAGILAEQIASRMPHLVALQEVTLWRTGATPATATTVRWDQLELLMTALKGLGAPYEVVAVNTLTDIALPTTEQGPGAVRFTDRDVLLARSDLRPPEFHLSDVHAHIYKAAITFGEVTVRRGFISALARVDNKLFRIANTHLETPYPGAAAAVIQKLQAGELVDFMRNSPKPVILAGDYNADAILAENGPGPDNTDTVPFIQAAGYADSWAAANPSDPGPTWPLFLEDQNPPSFFFIPATPWERIDLIFFRGLEVVGSARVGEGLTFPAAASDHTGVMSTFRVGH
jgi:endonuclease/exonuclease/phosphatase family metal-dependent hydrolase